VDEDQKKPSTMGRGKAGQKREDHTDPENYQSGSVTASEKKKAGRGRRDGGRRTEDPTAGGKKLSAETPLRSVHLKKKKLSQGGNKFAIIIHESQKGLCIKHRGGRGLVREERKDM